MKQISKIKILSLGKILGILGAVLGLILGVVLVLVTNLDPATAIPMAAMDYLSFLGTLILVWGIGGFLIGLLIAFLYNQLTNYMKGIEIDLK